MRIWYISFESIYTRKVGGLAEVPPRLGKAVMDRGHEVYILTPSHGSVSEDYKLLGEFRVNDRKYRVYLYDKPPVPHIVFSGGLLDDPEVYSPDKLLDKALSFAQAIKIFTEENSGKEPDIIHGNDWHSVPALLALNSLLKESAKYYYQIHLLSKTRFRLEDLTYGLGLDPHTLITGIQGRRTLREYYEYSWGLADRLGALISNKLLTVSKDYSKTLIRRLGFDLEEHVDYIPNAITWTLDEVCSRARKLHPDLNIDARMIMGSDREFLRRYLEIEAPRHMGSEEPLIYDREFKKFIEGIDEYPFHNGGKIQPFTREGPLVFMTGRLSRQKGIHVLLKVIGEIIANTPEVRILLLLLPVWGERRMAEELINNSILHHENLRVVFGVSKTLFHLTHLAGDVMMIPSTYEPFGLVALEGMITGNAIVASKTGGLAETVLDIRRYGVKGTGLHIEPGDPWSLVDALTDMVLFMESGYHEPWSSGWWRIVSRIGDRRLYDLLISNPRAPWIIRRSSHRRAMEYTWDKSAEKALRIYMG